MLIYIHVEPLTAIRVLAEFLAYKGILGGSIVIVTLWLVERMTNIPRVILKTSCYSKVSNVQFFKELNIVT